MVVADGVGFDGGGVAGFIMNMFMVVFWAALAVLGSCLTAEARRARRFAELSCIVLFVLAVCGCLTAESRRAQRFAEVFYE